MEQVKAGRVTEVKRMLEFEVYEEVSEELARGKRIWNSAWLDSQKKPGLVRSRLVVNQVRGACKREDVFAGTPPLAAMRFVLSRAASRGHGRCIGSWDVSVAFFHATIEEEVFLRPPKNMRKDETIWKLLKAMYGTQGASSRWQWPVRETLCDGQWKILTSVPCVGYNETEDSMVVIHGDDFVAESHDRSLDKLNAVLDSFEIKRSPRIGPAAGHEGAFSAQNDAMEQIWILVSTRSQARGCTDCDFIYHWKKQNLFQRHIHAIQERVKQTRCVS